MWINAPKVCELFHFILTVSFKDLLLRVLCFVCFWTGLKESGFLNIYEGNGHSRDRLYASGFGSNTSFEQDSLDLCSLRGLPPSRNRHHPARGPEILPVRVGKFADEKRLPGNMSAHGRGHVRKVRRASDGAGRHQTRRGLAWLIRSVTRIEYSVQSNCLYFYS